MRFKFSGRTEVYLEIAERFREYIDKGVYKGGDKLPSVRRVAEDLGVNPNTVARAYSTLEDEGIIHTLPKKGVYVSDFGSCKDEMHTDATAFINRLKAEGMSYEELLRIIEEVYKND